VAAAVRTVSATAFSSHANLIMKSCVQCGYSLRGLSARHECPECGLPFDERSQTWRTRYNKRLIVTLALISLGWLLMTWSFSTGLRRSPLPPPLLILLHLGFAALFLFLLYRFWRLYRGGFVATMPTGLYLRTDQSNTQVIEWSNISRAAVIPSPLGVVLFLKREKTTRNIVGPFRKREDAEDFVRHVEARLASAGAEP
jgi:predicted RNA-binding Zn-ribbon protein involved in translation (DUF1610 family)